MIQRVFHSELKVMYELHNIEEDKEDENYITLNGILEVNANRWCTLVCRRGHSKKIDAFEVTLGPVQ